MKTVGNERHIHDLKFWNGGKEKVQTETIHICTTKPERKCNFKNVKQFGESVSDECNIYYETTCETKYVEEEVVEDQSICNDIMENICDDNGENCYGFSRQVILLSYYLNKL